MTQVSPSLLITALEAAGEITRLRLLALLSEAEVTVSELVTILGQSQPRISRHLKLLAEAGLIERHREGAWAFFRLADRGALGEVAQAIVGRLERADPLLATDHARLAEVRQSRAEQVCGEGADHADDCQCNRQSPGQCPAQREIIRHRLIPFENNDFP